MKVGDEVLVEGKVLAIAENGALSIEIGDGGNWATLEPKYVIPKPGEGEIPNPHLTRDEAAYLQDVAFEDAQDDPSVGLSAVPEADSVCTKLRAALEGETP